MSEVTQSHAEVSQSLAEGNWTVVERPNVMRGGMMEREDGVNRITERVIGAAMRVHTALGPGLLESAYESCLALELAEQGMAVERQQALPVVYRDLRIACGYRLDLVVEDAVIVELKSVETLERVHVAQMLTYLKLSRYPVGLLINFNVMLAKEWHPPRHSLTQRITRCVITPLHRWASDLSQSLSL